MTNEKFSQLLNGYIRQSLSAEELSEFLAVANLPEYQGLLAEALDADLKAARFGGLTDNGQREAAFGEWMENIGRRKTAQIRRLWARMAVAACLILLLGSGAWYLLDRRSATTAKETLAQHPTTPIKAGKDQAVLTLGDGSQIVLDSTGNGRIASQGGTRVVKTSQGRLAYQADASEAVVYNTVATPRAGQFQIRLPDGTDVWLNAVSSIKFPTAFKGNDRTVEITGEVYFEVRSDPRMPFRVKVNDMTVDVLGTHFNINSYSNESTVRTTLLEGAVRISKATASTLLHPGQQAQTRQESTAIEVLSDVDTEQTIAWKNGFFNFDNADIGTIMRQLARWYDVDVDYSGVKTNERFFGGMERNLPLASVIKFLEKNKIHFQIDGRKITAFD